MTGHSNNAPLGGLTEVEALHLGVEPKPFFPFLVIEKPTGNVPREATEDMKDAYYDLHKDRFTPPKPAEIWGAMYDAAPKPEIARQSASEPSDRSHWKRLAHDRVVAANAYLARARQAEAALTQIATGTGYYGAQALEYKNIAREAMGIEKL